MTYEQARKLALEDDSSYTHVQDLGDYWKFYKKEKSPVQDAEITIRKSDGAVFSFSELVMMGVHMAVLSDTPI